MRTIVFTLLAVLGPFGWLPAARAQSPRETGPSFLFDRSSHVLSIDRFEITVAWRDSRGNTGAGQPVSMTASSAYFTFFSGDNVEIVLKRHDGCAVNGRDWFFISGLTDVEVTITVKDTVDGATKVYRNPLGRAFRPILDTSAFVGCHSGVSQRIGPAGGAVTSADGRLRLTVPPAALHEEVTISIREVPVGSAGAPLDAAAAGLPLEKVYLLAPDGLQFAKPVAVRYASPQQPSAPGGTGFGSVGQLLLLSDESRVELLDSRTRVNTESGLVEVHGALEHFTLLSVSNSSAANGVGFFLLGVPLEVEVGNSFTATAVVAGNLAPTGQDFVTAVGPATYTDSTSAPLTPNFAPLAQQIPPSPGNKERWEGKFGYTCTQAGLATLKVGLEVTVEVRFPGSPAERATSFDEFIGFVRCVDPDGPPALGCAALAGDYLGNGGCGIAGPVQVSAAGGALSFHPFGVNGPTEFEMETPDSWFSQSGDLIIFAQDGHSCSLSCGAPFAPPESFALQCSRQGASCMEVFLKQ